MAGRQAEEPDPRSLWFIPPDDGESSRPTLTRERVVAEGQRGVQHRRLKSRGL